MGCTHPFGYDEIHEDGELVGIRCKTCGMEAYGGEPFWAALRRTFTEVFLGRGRR